MRLLDRQPGYDAATYADAQALVDDGLDVAFVLSLYPEEATWLRPMLDTAGAFIDATRMEQSSYYFESSLKQKFLAAAEERSRKPILLPVPEAPRSYARMRTAFAGAGVAAAAIVAGVVTLGVVTGDNAADPGDWRQVFRSGKDTVGPTNGFDRTKIDLQLKQTEERLAAIREQISSGIDTTKADLQRLEQEFAELAKLAIDQPLAADLKAKYKDIGEKSAAVLQDVKQKQPDLEPAVETTLTRSNEAVAAGLGTVKPVDTGTPAPTAMPSPSATPADAGTATPTASGTATPAETPTPSATPTEPPATATPTPSPTATASASATAAQ